MTPEYVIIEAVWPEDRRTLEERVNQAIKNGYIPAGGIVVFNDKLCGRRMMQAMKIKNGQGKE